MEADSTDSKMVIVRVVTIGNRNCSTAIMHLVGGNSEEWNLPDHQLRAFQLTVYL